MIHQSESLTSLLAHNLSLDARSLGTPCHKMHPRNRKRLEKNTNQTLKLFNQLEKKMNKDTGQRNHISNGKQN